MNGSLYSTHRLEKARVIAFGRYTPNHPILGERTQPPEHKTEVNELSLSKQALIWLAGLAFILAACAPATVSKPTSDDHEPAHKARAAQLMRYLDLVAIEYGKAVSNGQVQSQKELDEALMFQNNALRAYTDLQEVLETRNTAVSAKAGQRLAGLGDQLAAAAGSGPAASAAEIQESVAAIAQDLAAAMPAEWTVSSGSADFEVIAGLLEQVADAVKRGDYQQAEASRLEAYAVLESGPEARLIIAAPQAGLHIEDLFWNGQENPPGLAYLIQQGAPPAEIVASLQALQTELTQVETLLSTRSAPLAVAANAGIIVFREGLEAVLILASLLGSLKLAERRRYRRPIVGGAGLALLASLATWFLARGVLLSLARYGEKLEAVVSLVAIGMLLLITNWFFYKSYWNEWLASMHARKQRLLSREAGLLLGLLALGFATVYREGFEAVLFLQALVLEGGQALVLVGVGVGLLVTGLVGLATFRLQVRLPYKTMLVVTGVLIGGVLLVMVGKTAHVMQLIGWLPTSLIGSISLPYWFGTWFGVYPTWEGVGLQLAAAIFVIGSYFLAEKVRKRRIFSQARLSQEHQP
jgi:high-affinity iron transporter